LITTYIQKHANSILIRIIILAHLLLSYNVFNGWWYSLFGTAIIIFLSRKIWKDNYYEWIGLDLNLRKVLLSFILLAFVTTISYLVIYDLSQKNDVIIKFYSITILIHIIGYTLNEEILLGAIPLNYIRKKFQALRNYQISIIVALVFCILHYIFYRWIFLDFGILTLFTLVSLFLVGVIRNNLFLSTGHIGYSWAFHAGWVFIMFGFDHFRSSTEILVNESDRFNIYLGSTQVLVALFVLSLLSLLLLLLSPNKVHRE